MTSMNKCLLSTEQVEAKIDKTYPTETEAHRVIRFMQNVFEWADEVFNRVIEARNLVTKAKVSNSDPPLGSFFQERH